MSNSTSALSQSRTNPKTRTNRVSPRLSTVTHFHFDEEETFEDDADSSSEYDPNEDNVEIDFDEASTAWRANKRCTGNGTFVYTKPTVPAVKHNMRLRSMA